MTGHYLLPGDLFAAHHATAVKTLLGSCVSVCLWDASARVGGINHFLLPHGQTGVDRPGRYGNLAMPALFDELSRLGATSSRTTAKVFGGAAILAQSRPNHIGVQNVEVALAWLERAGLRVVALEMSEFRKMDGGLSCLSLRF